MEIVGCLNTNELLDLPTQFHLELDVTSEMASASNLNHKHHRNVSFPLMKYMSSAMKYVEYVDSLINYIFLGSHTWFSC